MPRPPPSSAAASRRDRSHQSRPCPADPNSAIRGPPARHCPIPSSRGGPAMRRQTDPYDLLIAARPTADDLHRHFEPAGERIHDQVLAGRSGSIARPKRRAGGGAGLQPAWSRRPQRVRSRSSGRSSARTRARRRRRCRPLPRPQPRSTTVRSQRVTMSTSPRPRPRAEEPACRPCRLRVHRPQGR